MGIMWKPHLSLTYTTQRPAVQALDNLISDTIRLPSEASIDHDHKSQIYDISNNYVIYNEYQFYLYTNLVYTNEVKGNERHCRKM